MIFNRNNNDPVPKMFSYPRSFIYHNWEEKIIAASVSCRLNYFILCLELQISTERSDDIEARKLRNNSNQCE